MAVCVSIIRDYSRKSLKSLTISTGFLPLKRQSRLQQTTNFVTSLQIFNKKGILYENRLPADDSREISCLICYF